MKQTFTRAIVKKKKSRSIQRRPKSVSEISRAVSKIIDWNKKSIGLSVNLQKAINNLDLEQFGKFAAQFLIKFEEECILQEMHEWYDKVKAIQNPEENLNEIRNVVEALIDKLFEEFDVQLIQEPNSIIDTPKLGSRYYRFENKYSPKLKKCKVLRPGLKNNKTVISPCILIQVGAETNAE